MAQWETTDVLVAGAGLAGLYAALCAARAGARVTVVTKGALRSSTSMYAQGGIAAAVGPGDSPAAHAADTLRVGRGLCDPDAVALLTGDAPARIADLESLGVRFDRATDGRPHLGREGGHGRHRILHAGGSATGRLIAEALLARVCETRAITILEHRAVVGLIADGDGCDGAWLLGQDELVAVSARATVLATGGATALFARTTNPPGATGDGIALAARAGAAVSDMEFVQFHPTALAGAAGDRAFLISEAVRGEGAHLVGADGRRFMHAEHPDAELAPRDVVAAAIERRLERGERSYLDLRHLPAAAVRARFGNLVDGCRAAGYDLLAEPVPVAPAAHYLMGGIETDRDGASTLPGLYAAGECAATGVHGANRLASNSLLECFVFAARAVAAGLERPLPATTATAPPERPLARAPLAELRRRMWRHAGLVRDADGLGRLLGWLEAQPQTNPVLVASLVAAAALRRTESRGAHLRRDHPREDPSLRRRLRCPITVSTS